MPRLTTRLRSLDDLRAMCAVHPITGCWDYNGRRGVAKNGQGYPVLYVSGVSGGLSLQVALPLLATGREPREGVKYVPTCGKVDCLNWEHRREGTLSEVLQLGAKKHAAARALATEQTKGKLSEAVKASWAKRKAATGPKLHDKLEPLHTRRGPAMPALRKPGSNARPVPVQQPAPGEARITDKTRVTICESRQDFRYTVQQLPPGYVSALDPGQARPWAQAAAQGRAV